VSVKPVYLCRAEWADGEVCEEGTTGWDGVLAFMNAVRADGITDGVDVVTIGIVFLNWKEFNAS